MVTKAQARLATNQCANSARMILKTYSKSKRDSKMGLVSFFEKSLCYFRDNALYWGVKLKLGILAMKMIRCNCMKAYVIRHSFMEDDIMDNYVLSKGGTTKAYKSLKDNILLPNNCKYPPLEITSKIVESQHSGVFTIADLEELQAEFGFYTDLQSDNSEDAVTWSYFGYLSKMNSDVRLDFLNSLVDHLNKMQEEKIENQNECEIKLWHRFAHPQKPSSSNGPELDALIFGNSVMLLIECKWNAKIGKGQGINNDLDQLEIRKQWIEKLGEKMFPSIKKKILLVVREKNKHKYLSDEYLVITWEELSNLNIPHQSEFQKYIYNK